jgi:hypothetical protein
MSLDLGLTIEEPGHGEGQERSPGRTYAARVQLRRGWVRYPIGGGRDIVLDFERRRRLEIDGQARTFQDSSLYPEVGARHFQLLNRDHVYSVLEAGQADPADLAHFDPVLVEHELSVLNHKRKTTIGATSAAAGSGIVGRLRGVLSVVRRPNIGIGRDGGHEVYEATTSGRRLLSHTTDGAAVEPAISRQFVQFLRYAFGGHPLVLERIAGAERIPREIHFTSLGQEDSAADEVRLHVDAMEPAAEGAIVLGGLRRVIGPGAVAAAFGPALEMSILGERPDVEEVSERSRKEALAALEEGRALEALLILLELTLQTGDPLPGLGDVVHAEADVTVRRLLEVLKPGTGGPPEARASVDTLLQLREAAGPRQHVLMSFESGIRAGLGETNEAIELLGKVLSVNPFLTAVYKDMGDLQLQRGDTRTAWLCWEAARAIAPDHPVLQLVAEFEARLARAHPEYF